MKRLVVNLCTSGTKKVQEFCVEGLSVSFETSACEALVLIIAVDGPVGSNFINKLEEIAALKKPEQGQFFAEVSISISVPKEIKIEKEAIAEIKNTVTHFFTEIRCQKLSVVRVQNDKDPDNPVILKELYASVLNCAQSEIALDQFSHADACVLLRNKQLHTLSLKVPYPQTENEVAVFNQAIAELAKHQQLTVFNLSFKSSAQIVESFDVQLNPLQCILHLDARCANPVVVVSQLRTSNMVHRFKTLQLKVEEKQVDELTKALSQFVPVIPNIDLALLVNDVTTFKPFFGLFSYLQHLRFQLKDMLFSAEALSKQLSRTNPVENQLQQLTIEAQPQGRMPRMGIEGAPKLTKEILRHFPVLKELVFPVIIVDYGIGNLQNEIRCVCLNHPAIELVKRAEAYSNSELATILDRRTYTEAWRLATLCILAKRANRKHPLVDSFAPSSSGNVLGYINHFTYADGFQEQKQDESPVVFINGENNESFQRRKFSARFYQSLCDSRNIAQLLIKSLPVIETAPSQQQQPAAVAITDEQDAENPALNFGPT